MDAAVRGPLDWRLLIVTTLGLWAAITFVLGCHDPAAECCAACKEEEGVKANKMAVIGPSFWGQAVCVCENGRVLSLPRQKYKHVECEP